MHNWSKVALSTAIITVALFLSETANAKVIIKETTVYYTLKGKDGGALGRYMESRGPSKTKLSHAIASTQTHLKFNKTKVAGRRKNCVEDTDIILNLKYTFPKWHGRKNASKTLGRAWDDFNKQLVIHEKRHGKIAKDAAYAFEKQLKGLKGKVSKDCSNFDHLARLRFAKICDALASRQNSFDRRDGYGSSNIAYARKILFQAK